MSLTTNEQQYCILEKPASDSAGNYRHIFFITVTDMVFQKLIILNLHILSRDFLMIWNQWSMLVASTVLSFVLIYRIPV